KFYVAGFQYYDGPSFIEDIQAGEQLKLVAQPDNKYDKFAVAIYWKNSMIGHVPRTDNKHLSRLLRQQVGLLCEVIVVKPQKETWNMVKVAVYL
ncbi:MAG: HIRAN domain-containing protein, partial [Balneolaceae bacterium]|nr:HIRAN domain-containing protein [Balneolaceae bacterium]